MHNAIIDFLKDKSVSIGDTLVFYLSGHGVPDERFNVYLASSKQIPLTLVRWNANQNCPTFATQSDNIRD